MGSRTAGRWARPLVRTRMLFRRLFHRGRLRHLLIHDLEAAYSSGVLSLDNATPYQWAAACSELLNHADRIDLLEFAARQVHAAYPELTYLATLVAWFDAMPRQLPAPLAFTDKPAAEIQVVQRTGCDAVLLCFCGMGHGLGVPLNLSHQWLGRLPVSLVYIKDFRDLYGGYGYPSLATDSTASVAALRRLVHDIGGKRIYTLGVSMGGYPALYYGLQLGAAGALSLSGATDLTPAFVERQGSVFPAYPNLLRQAPEYAKNLCEAYAATQHRPHVLLAFSAENSRDRQQAERMLGLPNVEFFAVGGHAGHNVVDPLIRSGDYLPLLHRLLSKSLEFQYAVPVECG